MRARLYNLNNCAVPFLRRTAATCPGTTIYIYYILVVAHGFPRCKPIRIPDKMPENKMSENGKPVKMPDN